ncbi:MAG: methylthioribulose 1-phosphate dehydratase [Acidobacteria bacterium]|nr:methylthioribulose 1-phosphate dehydratase [Acidobacteriota bacterium]
MSDSTNEIARLLAEAGKGFYQRGWVLGTSGNFSAVVSREPLRLVITPSGADKGALTADQFVQVDHQGKLLAGDGRPSDETKLHLTVVQKRKAKVVLHTHSVWSTIVSDQFAEAGAVNIEGYEMLKGLAGVSTHEHREVLPILENLQDMEVLGGRLAEILQLYPQAHGFLLCGHGLYTWGQTIKEARRHVEILEFLLEITGRTKTDRKINYGDLKHP